MNPKHVGVVEIYSTNESVVSRQTQKGGVRNISARLDISIYSRLPNRTTIPLTYQVIRRSIGMTNRINFVGTRTPRWIKLIPIASARNVEMLFADTHIHKHTLYSLTHPEKHIVEMSNAMKADNYTISIGRRKQRSSMQGTFRKTKRIRYETRVAYSRQLHDIYNQQ